MVKCHHLVGLVAVLSSQMRRSICERASKCPADIRKCSRNWLLFEEETLPLPPYTKPSDRSVKTSMKISFPVFLLQICPLASVQRFDLNLLHFCVMFLFCIWCVKALSFDLLDHYASCANCFCFVLFFKGLSEWNRPIRFGPGSGTRGAESAAHRQGPTVRRCTVILQVGSTDMYTHITQNILVLHFFLFLPITYVNLIHALIVINMIQLILL